MNRSKIWIITGLFAIALCVLFGQSAEAGNYPPATPDCAILNLDFDYNNYKWCTGEFSVMDAEVFLYDAEYDVEKNLNGQIVRGLVRLSVHEGDSGLVDFPLYGSAGDTTQAYNHVIFLLVPGHTSSAKIEETLYEFERGMELPDRDRTLVIKVGSDCDGAPCLKLPTLPGEGISPYVKIIGAKKANLQSNSSQ